jgi:hypothetical protein
MLVCNISLLPRRRAIITDIEEVAAAADAPDIDNAIYASLVDDPSATADLVDAFLGEIMLEPASATDTVDAGLIYNVGILENITAIEASDGIAPQVYTVAITEAASATDAPDFVTTLAARILSASRAGIGSTVVVDDLSGKTRIISNIGAVS